MGAVDAIAAYHAIVAAPAGFWARVADLARDPAPIGSGYGRPTHLVLEGGSVSIDTNPRIGSWVLTCGHVVALVIEPGLLVIDLGEPMRCPTCTKRKWPKTI